MARRGLLVVATLVGALWIWLAGRDGARSEPELPPAPAAATGASAQAELQAPAPPSREPTTEPSAVEVEPAAVPEAPPLEEGGADPADPVERGACALDLFVTDAVIGLPIESGQIELWRLAAPGNAHWTEGDQLQATLPLERGRVHFADLPEGRYRAFCSERRAGADDPPPIDVVCPSTQAAIAIELARTFRVLLDVRDESGLPLDACSVQPPTDSTTISPPGWIQARERRTREASVGVVAVEWTGLGKARALTAGAEGFELGEYSEATARSGHSRHLVASFEGRTRVRCAIRPSGKGDQSALAVSVAWEPILESVRAPDGRPLSELDCAFEADCNAVSFDGRPPDWREIPIHVRVRCAGCEPLEFEVRLSAWPPPSRTLVPAKGG